VVITVGVERERRRKRPRSTILLGFACGGGGAWGRCAAIVLVFAEVLLYDSWIFKGLFCNFFYMLEYVSKLLLVFCLIYIIL